LVKKRSAKKKVVKKKVTKKKVAKKVTTVKKAKRKTKPKVTTIKSSADDKTTITNAETTNDRPFSDNDTLSLSDAKSEELARILKITNIEERRTEYEKFITLAISNIATDSSDEPVDPSIPITGKPTDPPPIPLPVLRILVEMYYDFQNTRIRTSNRSLMNALRNGMTKEDLEKYGVDTLFNSSKAFEKNIEKRIRQDLKSRPIYTEYLSLIKGIGPVLAAGLIAWMQSPANYDNISKLWQNAGLGMNQYCEECKIWVYDEVEIPKTDREGKVTRTKAKRLSGKIKICNKCGNGNHLKPHPQAKAAGLQLNWNPKFKTLCWKIGSSFIKQKATKSWYRSIYDMERAKREAKFPTSGQIEVRGKKRLQYNPKHHFEAAKRHTVKTFMANLWLAWRVLEGLNLRAPFTPKGTAKNHRFIPPVVDEGELPQLVTDKLNELNATANCYPSDMQPDWIPRVDKTKVEDTETQKLNDESSDNDENENSNGVYDESS
jgi:hypothetical protein